jgi:fatty-acyl-CoA synthase
LTSPITSDLTLHQALSKSVGRHARRKALTYGDETLTYAEVGARVEHLARGLRNLGVAPGDKVAFLLPSCLDAPIVFFAPAALGAVIVPINPVYRQKEIQHILADSEASVVIAEPQPVGNDLQGILEAIRPSLPHLKHVVWRGRSKPGILSLTDLPMDTDPLPERPVPPEALCALVYTSGTTGVPKAVMHSHSSMIAAAASQQRLTEPLPLLMWHFFQLVRAHGARFLRLASGSLTTLSLAPLHSLIGYGTTLYGLLLGHHIVIADRFHPARILELVEEHRINVFSLTPTMLAAVLETPELKSRDLSSLLLLYVGAAPVPPDLVRRARAELKCPVLISFGTTEVGGGVMMSSFSDPIDLQGETVGRLLPGIKAKIVDVQDREVPLGQVGELALQMSSHMLGYYKAPELTSVSLDRDGWYYTGDLATKDARGYFRIVGRKKDMIIRGGQNIFPTEIENHLLSKPGIQNVAVVGVPDPIVGERVWAYVLPQPGANVTPALVVNYCRGELAPFKVPDQVRLVDDLPLTTTGKVQKYLLQEKARQELMAASA